MQCPHCQTDNRRERKFCAGCGKALTVGCPRCGFENTPEEQFCGGCGQPLAEGAPAAQPGVKTALAPEVPRDLAAKILATRGRIEGERRQVTVLFCDLANSTWIAEQLDPEIFRQLINDYLEASIRCVYRYEGIVNQIAGDGFMAILGAPIAHDDDAARACRMALDIMGGIRSLSQHWEARIGRPIMARIGLNTGLVVVGTVGNDLRMDYTAIGDTTNVASRIQTFAQPGEIFLSEATRKLVAHRFETEEAGTETFKGKREQTAVFRLLREVPRRVRRHQMLRAGLSHFCGRQPELALLHDRFAEANNRRGQVVFIGGEAGIGKSRLIHEFRRTLNGDSYHWLEGQCVSYGTLSTYHPFIDLLRGAFDIDEADSPEVMIEKVHDFCATRGGLVARGEPFYRDLLSLGSGDPRVDRMLEAVKTSNYFESVRDLGAALSAEKPVICLFEDIHWIDQSSEQMLRRLLDNLARARVLALITHRPGFTWPHGDRSYFSRISLPGLPDSLVDELAQSVLGAAALPRPVKRLIAERSDGNPFFVEEIAKSLQETGLLDGPVTEQTLAAEVPSTVQEVIMARIDRLDDEAKHALQVASVIGREFAVRILERMQEWHGSASDTLDKLRSLELIYEKTVHPELAYMFKHALTHDVAYGTLLHAQRRELHRRIAELIEEIYADRLPEFSETLAYQYREAQLPERAAHYALRSGERALSHQAPEAEQYFRQAADLSRGRAGCEEIFIRAQAGLGDLLLLQEHIDAANAAYAEAMHACTDPATLRWLGHKVVHRRFIEHDGVRLAYYIQGEEGADIDPVRRVPIVILHPLIQGSLQFQLLAQRLCQEHCIIYTDPRGIGASQKTDEPYDSDVRAADAVAILQQLPYAKFILQGDSDGVRMAAQMFHAMPERIEKMVLFGGPVRLRCAPDYPIGYTEDYVAMLEQTMLAPDHRSAVRSLLEAAFSEPGLSGWREVALEWWMTISADTYRQFVREVIEADARHLLPGINVPTLVIAAEGDILIPLPFVQYVAEHIPGALFARIKGSSHAAPWTAIGTFCEIVTTFIRTGSLPRTEWEP